MSLPLLTRRPFAVPAVWTGRTATPLVAWPLALLAGGVGAYAAVRPALAVGLLLLGVVAYLGARVLARPTNGICLALAFFPVYTLLRGLAKLWGLPVPLAVLGMWPEAVLVVMIAGSVLEAIKTRRPLPPLTWDDAPMVVLVVGGVYGLVLDMVQKLPGAAVYGAHYSLTAMLFYFAARWSRPSRADLRRILGVLLAGYVLLAVFSLLDYFTRTDFSIRLAMVIREGFWGQWNPYVFFRWYPRMQSLLFNEQVWGSLSAFACLICFAFFTQVRPKGWVWPLLGLAFLCLLLSMARGGMIVLAVGTLALLLFRSEPVLRSVAGAHVPWWAWPASVVALAGLALVTQMPLPLPVALAAFAVAAVLVSVVLGVRERHRLRILETGIVLALALAAVWAVLQTNEKVASLSKRVISMSDSGNKLAYDRVGQWQRGLDKFALAPSGTGLGTVGTASFYHGGAGLEDAVFDGGWFRVMAEQGVPGLLCGVVGVLGTMGALARRLRPVGAEPGVTRGLPRVLGLATLALLAGTAVQNVGQNAFDAFFLPYVLWTFAGLFLAHAHEEARGGEAAAR